MPTINRLAVLRHFDLKEMYCDGKSIRDIAKDTGIPIETVRRYLKNDGVVFRSISEALKIPGKTRVEISINNLPDNTREIGSTRLNCKGYVLVKTQDGWKFEHRTVMEQYISRNMSEAEVIHHLNGNKTDNAIENLRLMRDGEHSSLHNKTRRRSLW